MDGRHLVLLSALLLLSSNLAAHNPVSTRYRYHADVRPILVKHCGACHDGTGPAPMSLLEHRSARAWAEAVKEQLLTRAMPPSFAEPGYAALERAPLSARELDVLVDWTSGGAPEGTAPPAGEAGRPGAPTATGPAPVSLPLPALSLPGGTTTLEKVVSIDPGLTKDRYLAGWGLRPGNASVLRSARVSLRRSGAGDVGSSKNDGTILGTWVSGQDAWRYPDGAALRLPAGARLLVTMTYRRSWHLEGVELTDRSTLDLYLHETPATAEVRVRTAQSAEVPAGARIFGAMPPQGASGARLLLRGGGERPPGESVTLLDVFERDPAWPWTYRFAELPEVPAGGTVEWSAAGSRGEAPGGGVLFYLVP